jgi:hypothetical protein
MKLSEFLTINQGHQITDEEIYFVYIIKRGNI